MSMTPIWAVLRASSSCLISSSIRSSSSLTSMRLRHGQRLAAGELVLGGELLDLVLVAERLDERAAGCGRTATGRRRRRTRGAPGRGSARAATAWWKRSRSCLGGRMSWARSAKALAALLADLVGFEALEDLALALAEDGQQRVDAGAEAGDLAGVDAARRGRAPRAVSSRCSPYMSMCSKALRDEVGRRLRGAGEPLGVVLLVRVDDAAEGVAIGHGGRRKEQGAGSGRRSVRAANG